MGLAQAQMDSAALQADSVNAGFADMQSAIF
jgi:hypothetical protein